MTTRGPAHSKSTLALLRAIGIGAAVGAVAGGGVGTASFPLVGTSIAAVAGSVVGALFGLANGLILAAVVALTNSRWVAALTGALTTFACAAGLVAIVDGLATVTQSPPLIFASACTVVAVPLGPLAAYGAQPLTLNRRLGERSVGTIIRAAMLVGATVCGVIGAVVGGVLGVTSYLPTAPVAVFEGMMLAGVTGAVAALVLVTLVITPRLRVRR
jgi:hypothetical protein